MFHKKLLTLLGGVLALTLFSVQPAMAQSGGYDGSSTTTGRPGDLVRDRDEDGRRDRGRRQSRRAEQPSPEQNRDATQALLTTAGVDCTVDQGSAIGKNTDGDIIYEIGCADRDGYWIEQKADGWATTPCWDLAIQGVSCRYSTAAETKGAWGSVLAGTAAAACDVQQARRVGRDAEGLTVYEVKCGAGDGYFARIGAAFTAQRVHTCAEAANIGGGCTLTAAAPATPEEE